jgi:hypothetical protein
VTRLATEVAESSQQPQRKRGLAERPTLITMLCYVFGGFWVTAALWTNPVGLRQQGDPQDVNQATWFIRYTATAIEHFRLPALSTMAMNAPHGVNLMWNTSLLLPGIVVTPITALFGPQVSLTLLLVIGFAGSAAAMYYVLRRWEASPLAAALGGALYGFSPALVDSGIGHYSLVLAMLPPLMIDRVLRLVTNRGSAVRNGLWLGLLVAAQLFIAEEVLVDTVIAAVVLLLVLAACRPREILGRIRPLAVGLVTGGVLALVLCARGLWVQFHGVKATSAAATVIINYQGHKTNLGTLPYSFINPSSLVLLHTTGTGKIANLYPQPLPEYLAYLGVPLIIVLLAAIVYFWRNLPIRVAGLTCLILEWLGMGAAPMRSGIFTLPRFLLPWGGLQHLPVLGGMVPDRLAILADIGAAAVLAFSLDLARSGKVAPFSRWSRGSMIAAGIAVIALLPIVPAPYNPGYTGRPPAGWSATFRALHLPSDARVLLVPYPYSATSQVMRWQAVSGYPRTMIGGDFIAPNQPPHLSRAGRSAMTPTSYYLNYLYDGAIPYPLPSNATITANLASMKPNAVVAEAQPGSPLAKFLIKLFGQPTTDHSMVMGWRLSAGTAYPLQAPNSG